MATSDDPLNVDDAEPDEDQDRSDLSALVWKLAPFLDSQGRAFCLLKGDRAETGVVLPLDSEPVLSVLNYQFFLMTNRMPTRSCVNEALILTKGELWNSRPPLVPSSASRLTATLKAVVKAATHYGDFSGSATDALPVLKEVAKGESYSESLPKSADQLGIVFTRLFMPLREKEIELYRPERLDVKRLWAWRKIVRVDDTSDTSDTPNAGVSAGSMSGSAVGKHSDDTTDTLTERERHRLTLYREGKLL